MKYTRAYVLKGNYKAVNMVINSIEKNGGEISDVKVIDNTIGLLHMIIFKCNDEKTAIKIMNILEGRE